jgi:hypothetical protein
VLVVATAAGILIGTLLSARVPTRVARTLMLAIAWMGAVVVLVRGVVSLATAA